MKLSILTLKFPDPMVRSIFKVDLIIAIYNSRAFKPARMACPVHRVVTCAPQMPWRELCKKNADKCAIIICQQQQKQKSMVFVCCVNTILNY